jgi:hypothetical protein
MAKGINLYKSGGNKTPKIEDKRGIENDIYFLPILLSIFPFTIYFTWISVPAK